jgi:hypothetical protein
LLRGRGNRIEEKELRSDLGRVGKDERIIRKYVLN